MPRKRNGTVLGRSTGIVTERGENSVHVHSQGREQAGYPDHCHTREIAGHAGGKQEGLKPSPGAKTGGNAGWFQDPRRGGCLHSYGLSKWQIPCGPYCARHQEVKWCNG